jgi:hypothetical protein
MFYIIQSNASTSHHFTTTRTNLASLYSMLSLCLILSRGQDVDTRVKKERQSLVVIDDIVHDIHNFINEHPGSAMLIRSAIGTRACVCVSTYACVYVCVM